MSSPLSPHPSSKNKSNWLIGAFSLTAVFLGVLLFQQGGYLQTQVFTVDESVATENTTTSPESEDVLLDDYTRIEVYCQEIKQQYILECGNGYPERDLACRNEEANRVFSECMAATAVEDLPITTEESLLIEER